MTGFHAATPRLVVFLLFATLGLLLDRIFRRAR